MARDRGRSAQEEAPGGALAPDPQVVVPRDVEGVRELAREQPERGLEDAEVVGDVPGEDHRVGGEGDRRASAPTPCSPRNPCVAAATRGAAGARRGGGGRGRHRARRRRRRRRRRRGSRATPPGSGGDGEAASAGRARARRGGVVASARRTRANLRRRAGAAAPGHTRRVETRGGGVARPSDTRERAAASSGRRAVARVDVRPNARSRASHLGGF